MEYKFFRFYTNYNHSERTRENVILEIIDEEFILSDKTGCRKLKDATCTLYDFDYSLKYVFKFEDNQSLDLIICFEEINLETKILFRYRSTAYNINNYKELYTLFKHKYNTFDKH